MSKYATPSQVQRLHELILQLNDLIDDMYYPSWSTFSQSTPSALIGQALPKLKLAEDVVSFKLKEENIWKMVDRIKDLTDDELGRLIDLSGDGRYCNELYLTEDDIRNHVCTKDRPSLVAYASVPRSIIYYEAARRYQVKYSYLRDYYVSSIDGNFYMA